MKYITISTTTVINIGLPGGPLFGIIDVNNPIFKKKLNMSSKFVIYNPAKEAIIKSGYILIILLIKYSLVLLYLDVL